MVLVKFFETKKMVNVHLQYLCLIYTVRINRPSCRTVRMMEILNGRNVVVVVSHCMRDSARIRSFQTTTTVRNILVENLASSL